MRHPIRFLCAAFLGLLLFVPTLHVAASGAQVAEETLGVLGYGFAAPSIVVCDADQSTSMTLRLEQPPGNGHEIQVAMRNPDAAQDDTFARTGFMAVVDDDDQTDFEIPVVFSPENPIAYGDWFVEYIEVIDLTTGEKERFEPAEPGPSLTVAACDQVVETPIDRPDGTPIDPPMAPARVPELEYVEGDLAVEGYAFEANPISVCEGSIVASLTVRLEEPFADGHGLFVRLHNSSAPSEDATTLSHEDISVGIADSTQTTFTVLLPLVDREMLDIPDAQTDDPKPNRPQPYGDWVLDSIDVVNPDTHGVYHFEPSETASLLTVERCDQDEDGETLPTTNQQDDQTLGASGGGTTTPAGNTATAPADATPSGSPTPTSAAAAPSGTGSSGPTAPSGTPAAPSGTPAANSTASAATSNATGTHNATATANNHARGTAKSTDSGLAKTGSDSTTMTLLGGLFIVNGIVVLALSGSRFPGLGRRER